MLAWTTASLTLVLVLLVLAANYPTGDVQRCREAYKAARPVTVEARR